MRNINKGILCVLAMALFCCAVNAQKPEEEKIPSGSKVFIAPIAEFDSFLKEAIKDKKVPLVIVDDKSQADYEINGTSDSQKGKHCQKVDHGKLAFPRRGQCQSGESENRCDCVCVFRAQRQFRSRQEKYRRGLRQAPERAN